ARAPWLAVAELGGGERRDRILLAAPLDEAELLAVFEHALETEVRLDDSAGGKVIARRLTRLGRIVVRETLDHAPDPALVAEALLQRVRDDGVDALPWGTGARDLRARAAFLRTLAPDEWPDLSDAALMEDLDDWLAPLLTGLRALTALRADALDAALRARISWDLQRRLEEAAPSHWTAPTGTRVTIDYAADGGPRVEIRVQELFGLATHPAVANGAWPLTLALLSPARRPMQTTRDLPGFWRGSWKDVRSEMRGRYPKHPWPEDPAAAQPTTRAKPRG
ncbi:MAG: ATP-dependent helicase C-terminal domain-containing protein, partial [Phenylobacterium sp.]|uniref:ATP-dependent helicase C-terminal domain-containing protein n=1 Tax=Phenylobacterium sp. TaxID=1871053 RepID=UPI0027322E48